MPVNHISFIDLRFNRDLTLKSGFAYLLTAKYSIGLVMNPANDPASIPVTITSKLLCYRLSSDFKFSDFAELFNYLVHELEFNANVNRPYDPVPSSIQARQLSYRLNSIAMNIV
jgi:hypothetical protein